MKYIKYIVVLCIIFGLSGAMLYKAYNEVKVKTIEQLNNQQILLAKEAAKGIESFFQERLADLKYFTQNDQVTALSTTGRDILAAYYNNHRDDIRSIICVDAEGRIKYRLPRREDLEGKEIVAEALRALVQSRQMGISDVFRSLDEDQIIAIHIPIMDKEVYRGALLITMPFDFIAAKYLKDIKIGEDGYAWIMSAKGIELYCPVPGHGGKSVWENCRDFPSILTMANEMVQGKEGVTTYSYNRIRGQKIESITKYAVYLPIRLGNTFWSIVVATPENEVLSIIKNFKDDLLYTAFYLIVTLLGVTFLVVKAAVIIKEEEKRKEAERALRESEARYRTLYETMTQGVVYQDREGMITSVNRAAEQILGRTQEEFLRRDSRDTEWRALRADGSEFPGEEHPAMVALRTGQKVHNVIMGVFNPRKDDYTWININASPQFQPGEQTPFQVYTTFEDITEQRAAAEELRKSEAKYRLLFENAPLGIMHFDAQGVITDLNSRFAKITGSPREKLLGFDMPRQLQDREMRHAVLQALAGEPGFYEGDYISVLGQKQTSLRAFFQPIRSTGGEVLGGVSIFEDITEKKRAEAERKNLEMQLFQAQKMEAIGTLAGGIAHDFNNILGAIMGYAEMATFSLEASPEAKRYIDQVLKASYRAKELVAQILAFSRKLDSEKKPLLLKLIIKEAMQLLRATLPTTIEIRQVLLSNTPILADGSQVHQILMNLATNAFHAMEDKGGVLEVRLEDVELERNEAVYHGELSPGCYVRLQVQDTGAGIPVDTLRRVFEPYFTTKEVGKGTGLGLASVLGIVKSHGGEISLTSEVGKGTTVSLYFPPVAEVGAGLTAAAPKALQTGGGRILFVDDEPALAELGRASLSSLGYAVTTTTDSQEALNIFREEAEPFDLVITDLTMPQMTGLDLARRLQEMQPDIPIIVCTGYMERLNQEELERLGIREVLTKPLGIRQLAEAVQQVVGVKSAA